MMGGFPLGIEHKPVKAAAKVCAGSEKPLTFSSKAVIGFGFVACGPGAEGNNDVTGFADEFIGTWVWDTDTDVELTVSSTTVKRSDKLIDYDYKSGDGGTYDVLGSDNMTRTMTMKVTDGKLTITGTVNILGTYIKK